MEVANKTAKPVLFCWSGGKDSCMALHQLRREPLREVVALLTTVTEDYDRISMHGVRRNLLERQAAALGLPLEIVTIPPQCVNTEYESRMEAMLLTWKNRGVTDVAFGDIFLQDLREYREKNLARVGMNALFPVWLHPTRELVREFIALGFRAVTVCVDPKILDKSFAGREIDADFLAALPAAADPCGENGEFHSFVYDGPGFSAPVEFTLGEKVLRDGFYFCDLLSAESSVISPR
ncbi:MAG TPA: hypothetical protein VIH72_08270 [Candidatus Acidoferrales bacterium]